MGVGGGPLWEIQWLPEGGGRVRRLTLTRRGLRNLTLAVGAATLLLLGILGIIPIGLRGLLQRFSVDSVRAENGRLRASSDRLREEALALTRRSRALADRGRRLAWTLGVAARIPADPGLAASGAAGIDADLIARLKASSARLEAVGAVLSDGKTTPPCPLASLPTALPVERARAVPVAQFGIHVSPFTGREEADYGATLAAPLGEPVLAPGAGRVVFAGAVRERNANEWTRLGNVVVLDHGGGVVTVLGHLADVTVRRGQLVTRGQRVGGVGQSGWTRVPALYFEVRWPSGAVSRPVDPALVALALPADNLDARLASPFGDLPDGFPVLEHLPHR